MENDGYETNTIHRRTDHRLSETSRSRDADQGTLPHLEVENNWLKKLLAEAYLDMHVLKDVLGVKR